jgi:hypothetical protein
MHHSGVDANHHICDREQSEGLSDRSLSDRIYHVCSALQNTLGRLSVGNPTQDQECETGLSGQHVDDHLP